MTMQKLMRRRSTIAFALALPLILLVAGLVIYPAFYAVYLSMLDRTMENFTGLRNILFLLNFDTFWMVVKQ